MITTMQAPYREPEDTTTKWIIIFIVLSLLAHAIIITAILLITVFSPTPKFATAEDQSPVTISLMPPPQAPPKKPIFVPTQPQQNVQPKQQPIESANDTNLQSRSKSARLPDSIMPDVGGKEHAPDMRDSPQIKAPQTPQVSTTQPTPKQAQPQKPMPPAPTPQMTPQPTPRPPEPAAKPVPPKPPQKAPPQVDPDTGLPVLPPLNAPTMATPDQAKPLAPSPSQQQVAGSVHGALGMAGDNSPAAMATEVGKYKQYLYSVVGSYWYPDINSHFGLIGVGTVTIRFTIHSDGTLSEVAVTDGDTLDQLKTISKNALVAPAPFKPFPPGMIKEVGDSYTDEFSFSVY